MGCSSSQNVQESTQQQVKQGQPQLPSQQQKLGNQSNPVVSQPNQQNQKAPSSSSPSTPQPKPTGLSLQDISIQDKTNKTSNDNIINKTDGNNFANSNKNQPVATTIKSNGSGGAAVNSPPPNTNNTNTTNNDDIKKAPTNRNSNSNNSSPTRTSSTGAMPSTSTAVAANNNNRPTSMSFSKPPNYAKFTKKTNDESPLIQLDVIDKLRVLNIEGQRYHYKLSYCYVSQRGYYPRALDKANQDSYLVCENILDNNTCHCFGIFDGHGEVGDLCAFFAADKFPSHLQNTLKRQGGLDALDKPNMETYYTEAFVRTNNSLRTSDIDDSLSGTTGITVIVKGDYLYIGNVGDSRAIIGTMDNQGKVKYSPLSHDQTPFRKDERERVKKKGALVMTIDQIEGNEPLHENWGGDIGDEIDETGDPPRLWDYTEEKPGCAFTRSIGDAVAEEIGVFAEPEVMIWPLSDRDKFAVIASDGVFEFLTSQAVIDMVMKFPGKPIEAAKFIVAEAYRLWLEYDERTDDISIVIIFFDDIIESPRPSLITTMFEVFSQKESPRVPQSARRLDAPFNDNRPVRRVMAKSTKHRIIRGDGDHAVVNEHGEITGRGTSSSRAAIAAAPGEDRRLTPRIALKSPEDTARIAQMVQHNFLFVKLDETQKQLMYKLMRSKEVTAGEIIIKEGDEGDDMYMVDKGDFTVLKKDATGVPQIVFEYTAPGSTFGELSLMYSQPRAATVKARTAGKLWSIDRHSFRGVILRGVKGGLGLLEVFKAIPLFEQVPFPQVQRLCQSLKEETYAIGDIIVSEENPPKWVLCLVVSGTVKLKPKNSSTEAQTRGGSTYVLADELIKLQSKLEATSAVKIACLTRAAYDEVMGLSGDKVLKAELQSSTSAQGHKKIKPVGRRRSFVNDPEKFKVTGKPMVREDYLLEHPIILLGNYGYVGSFKNQSTNIYCSLKIIGKKKAADAQMDINILKDRQIVAALSGVNRCLSKVVSTFQNDKIVALEYGDLFRCDLALAIANNAIVEKAKMYYSACIYSAVAALHENAVLHRFINSSSVYITDRGVPKLVDMQYAKRMDGTKSFTICGDPLYFAPEIVSNLGYDFAADLWAYGMLILELFEGYTLFDTEDLDETMLFKQISEFSGEVTFSDKTPSAARELIFSVLKSKPDSRAGYHDPKEVRSLKFFKGAAWETLGVSSGFPMDLTTAVDAGRLFKEEKLENYRSAVFDQF